METASASRDSSWNIVLGWRGLGPMAPTGISSRPAPSSTAPGISADNPRPSPPRFIPCLPFGTGPTDASGPHPPARTPPPAGRPPAARAPEARPQAPQLLSERSLQASSQASPSSPPSLDLQLRLHRPGYELVQEVPASVPHVWCPHRSILPPPSAVFPRPHRRAHPVRPCRRRPARTGQLAPWTSRLPPRAGAGG